MYIYIYSRNEQKSKYTVDDGARFSLAEKRVTKKERGKIKGALCNRIIIVGISVNSWFLIDSSMVLSWQRFGLLGGI